MAYVVNIVVVLCENTSAAEEKIIYHAVSYDTTIVEDSLSWYQYCQILAHTINQPLTAPIHILDNTHQLSSPDKSRVLTGSTCRKHHYYFKLLEALFAVRPTSSSGSQRLQQRSRQEGCPLPGEKCQRQRRQMSQ